MALSSDEVVKREIIDNVGASVGPYYARVFHEGSNDDQRLFSDGGLTFSYENQDYGSCDCVYVEKKNGKEVAILAIEGTDCLGRGSSGNAQYQRFHHALGAVKNGITGIYYLRHGKHKVQEDLYGMAYNISKAFHKPYLIVQDLSVIKKILILMAESQEKLDKFINDYQEESFKIYKKKFQRLYKDSWDIFAIKRSTIIYPEYVIKYSARNKRNFTDSSQRAGHIAVGEMFLTKYFFIDKTFFYLWPRMTKEEIIYLDTHKSNDKEWKILRNEPGVKIITIEDLVNLPDHLKSFFIETRNESIKGDMKKLWDKYSAELDSLLRNKIVSVSI